MRKNDRLYYFTCYFFVIALTLLVLYPIIYIVSASFSSAKAVSSARVWLWPVEFSVEAYKNLFDYDSVWIGYRNTIFYTIIGTSLNIVVTMLCAYPLARKNLRGRKQLLLFFSFTMLFSGGTIPSYILVKKLGIMNTVWAVILPKAMSVYNMIVARTFIETNISDELQDAARVDGCDDFRFFFQMVLPLSKAILAVLTIWYAVAHWNAYFDAFLYLTDGDKYPLQLYLREILVNDQFSGQLLTVEEMMAEQALTDLKNLLKYAVIVVSSAPLLCAYPFAQKYFTKGVMIGSVKG